MFCLKVPTDAQWATEAVRHRDATLADHAHCELKAASNALSLAAKHPAHLELVGSLTSVAREEMLHFEQVHCLLCARGVALGKPKVDEYAARLRRACGVLPRRSFATHLVDRLLVGALIEARSCERFKLLSEAVKGSGTDRELAAVWAGLFAAEAGHYRTFVDLAVGVSGGDRHRVVARLELLAQLEAQIVSALAHRQGAARASVHG